MFVAVAGGGSTPRTVLDIENCHFGDHNDSFAGNTAFNGGALEVQLSSDSNGTDTVTIGNSTFSFNTANNAGGALRCLGESLRIRIT